VFFFIPLVFKLPPFWLIKEFHLGDTLRPFVNTPTNNNNSQNGRHSC
jgi:hypothetical protein